MTKISTKERIIAYSSILVLSVLFLLFFSLWESPFFTHWYGCDASFFSMAGRGITAGWVPYVDFFDLKGPYFFFIEALSQLICPDRLGVWILEIPFFYASFILIYEICRMFISYWKTIAVIVITGFLYIGTLWGGNTLEEYMLPLSLFVLYITLKHLDSGILPIYVPVTTGICFGIILFSKVTVGAPIAGVVIAICIYCLLKKNYRSLFKYLGLALLGVIIATIPIIIYFAYHNALSKMFYCVFAFAYKRSLDYSEKFNFEWEMKTFGCYFTFFVTILHPKKIKKPLWLIALCMSVCTYILLHLGVPFIYYFTTVFPVLVLGLAIFLKIYDPLILFKNVRQFICLAILAVLLYYYTGVSLDTIKTVIESGDETWYEEDYQSAVELATLIPKYERDQVFSFSIDMTWFEATRILPCYKYPINLQFFIALDPSIEADLTDYLNNTPPKWLIINESFPDEIPSLYSIVENKYYCICTNNSGSLYLLK